MNAIDHNGETHTGWHGGAHAPAGFLDLLFARVGLGRRAARRACSAGARLLAALLFHYAVGLAGALGEHLFLLLQIDMSESSWSQHGQATPFSVFEELMKLALRPLPEPGPPGRHGGLRRVVLDGVSFSLANTARMETSCSARNKNRRLAGRFDELAARWAMPRKRHWACPRVLRQPVQPWPRKRDQPSSLDPITISSTPLAQ